MKLLDIFLVCFSDGGHIPFETFHFFGEVTIATEEWRILAHTRQSLLYSSTSSSTFHTYCDTDQLFFMIISEDRQTRTRGREFRSGAVTTHLKNIVSTRPKIAPRSSAYYVNSLRLCHRGGLSEVSSFFVYYIYLHVCLFHTLFHIR